MVLVDGWTWRPKSSFPTLAILQFCNLMFAQQSLPQGECRKQNNNVVYVMTQKESSVTKTKVSLHSELSDCSAFRSGNSPASICMELSPKAGVIYICLKSSLNSRLTEKLNPCKKALQIKRQLWRQSQIQFLFTICNQPESSYGCAPQQEHPN